VTRSPPEPPRNSGLSRKRCSRRASRCRASGDEPTLEHLSAERVQLALRNERQGKLADERATARRPLDELRAQ